MSLLQIMAGRTPIESNFRIDNLTLNGAVNTTDWSEIIVII